MSSQLLVQTATIQAKDLLLTLLSSDHHSAKIQNRSPGLKLGDFLLTSVISTAVIKSKRGEESEQRKI